MDVLLVNPPPPPSQRVSRGLMGGFGMIVGEGLCYPPLDGKASLNGKTFQPGKPR